MAVLWLFCGCDADGWLFCATDVEGWLCCCTDGFSAWLYCGTDTEGWLYCGYTMVLMLRVGCSVTVLWH